MISKILLKHQKYFEIAIFSFLITEYTLRLQISRILKSILLWGSSLI